MMKECQNILRTNLETITEPKMIRERHLGNSNLRPRSSILSVFLLFSFFVMIVQAHATTYTVKATGGGNYTTIQACANAAQAGDTCTIYAGTYTENVTPPRNGSAGNWITFSGQSGAIMNGNWTLTNRSYIAIQGLTINGNIRTSQTSTGEWIRILNNTVSSGLDDYGIELQADDVLISGNTFSGLTNDMIHQWGTRWVIRNNIATDMDDVDNKHMDFWQSYCTTGGKAADYALIEDNYYANISGGNSHFALVNGTAQCSYPPVHLILRYNAVNNIGSQAIYIDTNNQAAGAGHNVIYNNTMRDLVAGASPYSYCCPVDASANSSGINNLFYNAMKQTSAVGFVGTTGWAQSYNLYYDPDGTMTFSSPASTETGAVKNQDPKFVSSSDLHLQAGSPAIGAGGPLTTVATADTGTGTSLIVNNADFFQPGWGGAEADWIRVGASTVQITSIDYAKNTITLANSISRSPGDAVYLYKKSDGTVVLNGSKPDIGAFPYLLQQTVAPPAGLTASVN